MRIQSHKMDGRNRIHLINSYRYEKAEFKTLSGETKGLGYAVL